MSKYTPLETLGNVKRRLWMDIRLVQLAEEGLGAATAVAADCVEVEKVLRVAVDELQRIIRRVEVGDVDSRKVRQGSDLALKAQVAKASGVAPGQVVLRRVGPSDK